MAKRVGNLDLFRCIAVLSVAYYHVGERFLYQFIPFNFLNIGRYGVELFFVLSGFLISNVYYKKDTQTELLKFWLQRFLRTYPPYLLALLLTFASVYIVRKDSFDWGYLIFLQNFYSKVPYFIASWSICVEEHFYLVFPLMVVIFGRVIKSRLACLIFWIICCLLPTLLRYKFGVYDATGTGFYRVGTIFRFDGIALGCLISFIIHKYNFSVKSNPLVSILLFLTLIAISYWVSIKPSILAYTIGYFLMILNVGALLVSFYFSREFSISKNGFVKNTALMAYSLYLVHALALNVSDVVINKAHLHNFFLQFSTGVIAIFLATVSFYYIIEKPSITFRNKILH